MKGYSRPRLDIIPSFYHEVGIVRRNETHLLHISRGNAREYPHLTRFTKDFTSNLKWKFRGSRYCRLDYVFCGRPSLTGKIIFRKRIREFKKRKKRFS